ncbi:MAG TPA: hypothetical protein VKZ62_00350 [Georgenia sp.]|nr:hypothetical protein [Georgenia sp.]
MAKIVRKDKLLAGYNGNLESVIVHNKNGEKVATSNGVFVVLEGLIEGEREVRKAVLASEADIAEDVLLIHNPEVMYDERLYKLEDFVIEKGKVARAYRLFDGDIITLTTDLFADKVDVGDVLTVKEDGLLGKPADATGAKVLFEVIEDCGNELHHETKAFAVQVKRN